MYRTGQRRGAGILRNLAGRLRRSDETGATLILVHRA